MSKDLIYFQQNRKEQYDYVTENIIKNDINKSYIIPAPVKSGKREMIEIQALYNNNNNKAHHIVLTSLIRRDTADQIEELERYGITILKPKKKNEAKIQEQLIEFAEKYKNGEQVYIHFDESDYGTNINGKLKNIFNIIKAYKIPCRLYSATNEEAMFGKFPADCLPKFKPHSSYKGSNWFLDNNLVKKPEPFWDENDNDISEQGKNICEEFCNQNDKCISVIRLNYNLDNDRSAFDYLINKQGKLREKLNNNYNIEVMPVTGQDKFYWGIENLSLNYNNYQRQVDAFMSRGVRTIIVINDTCTRSTEVKFHKHIYFWHDYRKEKQLYETICDDSIKEEDDSKRKARSCYNTMLQAFGRVFHYDETGLKIKLYANENVLQLDAGYITYEKYSEYVGKLSPRTNITTKQKIFDKELKEQIISSLNNVGYYSDNKYEFFLTDDENKAAEYCEKRGHKYEIKEEKNENGQYKFYYRNEMKIVNKEYAISDIFWGIDDKDTFWRRIPCYDTNGNFWVLMKRKVQVCDESALKNKEIIFEATPKSLFGQ